MHSIQLRPPYLLFMGAETRRTYAKTAQGIFDWRPELCAGQLRLTENTVDLGLPDMTIEQARQAGAGSLVIGTALVGGSIPHDWIDTLRAATRAGMDIVGGLHTRLDSIPVLMEDAARAGTQLIDVRTAPARLPIGTGVKRTGLRLLTVGTDCALGKKYTALQLQKDMRAAGISADFRASGQTGIMIAGSGIPIDCIVADFLSGAAEILSPENEPDHWDVIEGQGSIFHPGYAAVSHGLLLGSQPDAFVVCHAAGRTHIEGWGEFPVPSIGELIQRTVQIGRLTNPGIRCVGIAVNTSALSSQEAAPYKAELAERYQLPCVDPLADGTGPIVATLQTLSPASSQRF
ncbi:MAG: putative NAD-dependent epimerase/dehydratase family protein [Halieaceae bacterium]|jgi:uncharacterized NAD-dependent epimerase/dehydratase family protein